MKLIVHMKSNTPIHLGRKFTSKMHLRETAKRIITEGLILEEQDTGEKGKEEFYPPEAIFKVTMLL